MTKCEMQGCESPATYYGGYKGADSWAGYVCHSHTPTLAWIERIRTADIPAPGDPA